MLSLPYDKKGANTTYLKVSQSTTVLSGIASPWFGQPGGGRQYVLLEGTVQQLLDAQILQIYNGE
jgi:hypothetical protein